MWSLEVYRLGSSVTKPDEPVFYYLQGDDAPQRGFVREELLVVPSDTQLLPDGVLRLDMLGISLQIGFRRSPVKNNFSIV